MKAVKRFLFLVILPYIPASEYFHVGSNGVRKFNAFELFVKRVFDIVSSSIAIALTSPIIILAALAVKLDSKGPIFFVQERTGLNNKPFRMFKLRTMLQHDTPVNQIDLVTSCDPRITRVGKFLRNTSIDELPQLFNVLKGDMSLVGPRPQPVCHLEHFSKYIENYSMRHGVKPGITGLVQVSDMRSQVHTMSDQAKRVALDIEYINRWSLLFDVRICFKTVLTMLLRYNAHVEKFGGSENENVEGAKEATV